MSKTSASANGFSERVQNFSSLSYNDFNVSAVCNILVNKYTTIFPKLALLICVKQVWMNRVMHCCQEKKVSTVYICVFAEVMKMIY